MLPERMTGLLRIERDLKHPVLSAFANAQERIALFRTIAPSQQPSIATFVPGFSPRLLTSLFGHGVIERLKPIHPPCFRAEDHRRKGASLDMLLIKGLLGLLMRELTFLPGNAPGMGMGRSLQGTQSLLGFLPAASTASGGLAWLDGGPE